MSGLGMKRFKVKGIAGYGVKAGYSGCVCQKLSDIQCG